MLDEERLEFIRATRDSAGAIVPREGTLDRVRAQRFTRPGLDLDVRKEMAEMGWIGLRLPEEQGGVGIGGTGKLGAVGGAWAWTRTGAADRRKPRCDHAGAEAAAEGR